MARPTWPKALAFLGIAALFVASAAAMISPEPVREMIFLQPEWNELLPDQQKILKPLAGKWSAMKNMERKKWLGVAERYAGMPAAEKKRMQQRMRSWSDATPAQREAARKEYTRLKTQPAEQKDKFAEAYRHYLESKAAAEAAAAAAVPAPEAVVAATPNDAATEAKPEAQPLLSAESQGARPLW